MNIDMVALFETAKTVDINEYQMNTLDSFERAYRAGKYNDDLAGLAEAVLDIIDNPDFEPNEITK